MKVSEKCNGQKMRLDWILVRIGLNFHFLASKWHLIASKYPKFAVPWKWRFPARPFYSQMQWAKNEIGLDSNQNLSKFSIFSLKMALNCLKVPKPCCSLKLTISCKAFFLKTIFCIFSDTFTEHYCVECFLQRMPAIAFTAQNSSNISMSIWL